MPAVKIMKKLHRVGFTVRRRHLLFISQNGNNSPECSYVKLPYVGKFSAIAQKWIRRTIQRFCDNSLNIKLAFSSFKIGSLFRVKDLIPKELKSCVVYRFRCAGCGACYVGETSRHICTRINEHLNIDKASHISLYRIHLGVGHFVRASALLSKIKPQHGHN